jgi:hypothetical protein
MKSNVDRHMAAQETPSIDIVDYYDILVIGRTGIGKSTTSDKLVIANLTNRDYRGELHSMDPMVEGGRIKMSDLTLGIWPLNHSDADKAEIEHLIFFCGLDNPHQKINDFYRKQNEQTMKSRLISNDTTMVRVLDVPGFCCNLNPQAASANVRTNGLAIMQEVLRIQAAMKMDFKRILYLIPRWSPLEGSHEVLRIELEQMVHFIGKSIFDCMVLIATVNPDVYQYIPPNVIPFSSEAEMKIREKFQKVLSLVLPPGEQLPEQKPPIVFISMNDTCEDILTKVKTAPVIFNGMRLIWACIHCDLKTKFPKVRAEVVNSACYTVDPSCCIPYKESRCHPMIIQKYWGITKLLNFGGIYRTLTGRSYQPDEICIHCGEIPGKSGCMQVRTYYTVKHERLLVDHKLRIVTNEQKDKDSTFTYEKGAQISFLQKEIFKCDHSGFQYSMKSYGITLIVPKGSVAIGKVIHMEIGVTLCGPFSFPRGIRPISPVISLRLLGENTLTEPFQFHVTLRHILGELTELKARHHQVQFCCNDHISSDPGTYRFHLNDDDLISQSFTGSYGLIITKKFCFLCMTAADTSDLQSEIGYCLTRVVCTSELKNEAYLCLSYDAYLQV